MSPVCIRAQSSTCHGCNCGVCVCLTLIQFITPMVMIQYADDVVWGRHQHACISMTPARILASSQPLHMSLAYSPSLDRILPTYTKAADVTYHQHHTRRVIMPNMHTCTRVARCLPLRNTISPAYMAATWTHASQQSTQRDGGSVCAC